VVAQVQGELGEESLPEGRWATIHQRWFCLSKSSSASDNADEEERTGEEAEKKGYGAAWRRALNAGRSRDELAGVVVEDGGDGRLQVQVEFVDVVVGEVCVV